MSWRNKLIDSSANIEDFVRSHLSDVGITDPIIEIKTQEGKSGEEGAEEETEYDFLAKTQEGEKILHFSTGWGYPDNEDKEGSIIIFSSDYGKRSIGSVALKTILGIAFERSISVLELFFVDQNGMGFWPTFGAIPEYPPANLAETIGSELAKAQNRLSGDDYKLMRDFAMLAETNPYLAIRRLSQTNVKIDDEYFKSKIFGPLFLHENLYLIPGEPGTNAILKNRLGVLPPFRPLNPTHHRYHMSEILARSNVSTPILKL